MNTKIIAFHDLDEITEDMLNNDKVSLIVDCNTMPRIKQTDDSILKRVVVIPFDTTFVVNGVKISNEYMQTNDLETLKEAFAWYLINVYYKDYKKNGLQRPSIVTQLIRHFMNLFR